MVIPDTILRRIELQEEYRLAPARIRIAFSDFVREHHLDEPKVCEACGLPPGSGACPSCTGDDYHA